MTPPRPGSVVRTHADLLAMWQAMMGRGGFSVASVWLVFLDDQYRVQPVIVPIDGIPAEPGEGFTSSLAAIVEGLVAGGTVSSVAMLLSRPGAARMTDSDRRWAVALRAALGYELAAWPIHLATQDHVQVFAPDDLAAAS
ncbi:MAG: hypothetical protein QOG01_471 [Pseudonocardiales bacterium]|jgi:hypothetical protein|nr:hypothetical protein [Pseudonocardiales bacterium]